MALNASIFGNMLAQPKSPEEYLAERQQLEQGKMTNMLNRQKLEEYSRGVERQGQLRNLLATGPDSNALRQAGFLKEADDWDKNAADVAYKRAQTTKAEGDALSSRLEESRKLLSMIQTPEQYIAWHEGNHKDPVLGPFLAARGITADQSRKNITTALNTPGGLEQLIYKSSVGLDAFNKKLAEDRTFALKASNEIIGPDGKVNTTLLNAKKQVAQAGASSVNISTGQKGLDNEFKLRGEFKGEPVYKAHQEMQSAYNQIKQALGQATPAGDLAGATKIMKLLDPGSVVRESELGMAMQATGLMDRLDNYATNIINGTKLTPKQRQEFQQLANALYGESVKQYNAKRDEYERLGGEYGLNSGRAIGPRANLAAKPQPPSNVVDFGSLK